MPIRVGDQSNLQDGVIVHGTYQKAATVIGSRVSVGHGVILHGCSVGDEVLVGMGVILMDHVKIGKGCLIGAGTLLTEGTVIPDGSLVYGRPGKVVRPLQEQELEKIKKSADNYLMYMDWYR
jgi:carbonic anhydrase/acetyltransferase-like protein (isoleucine patch superfamily)